MCAQNNTFIVVIVLHHFFFLWWRCSALISCSSYVYSIYAPPKKVARAHLRCRHNFCERPLVAHALASLQGNRGDIWLSISCV